MERKGTGTNALRAACAVLLGALLLATGRFAAAAPPTDDDLRGYKGGIVEVTLRNGTSVRGVLYSYTATHLELELAGDKTVLLHRSWVTGLKAAPPGAGKSPPAALPPDPQSPYAAAQPSAAPPPRTAPPAARPTDTERPAEVAPAAPAAGRRSTAGAPPAAAPGGILARGLVFQFQIGGGLITSFESAYASWLNGSFLFGYKLGALTVGLGLEMTFGGVRYPNIDPDPAEQSQAIVLFQPTVEYYLAQRGRLVLLLTTGLDVGFLNVHVDPGKDENTPMVGFHTGAGLRYFVGPRFAVGILGGLRGIWILSEEDPNTNQDDAHWGVMALYGAATLTAIW